MHIDDIYNPAVAGDKDTLIANLHAGELDVNELVDCGVNSGVHTYVPVLFSVLATMSNSEFNYEILDILLAHGVDPNVKIELKSDTFSRSVPILYYAIHDWKNLDLINYLLTKGSYTDAEFTENYAAGYSTRYPLLYYGINCWDNCDVMNLLLMHGADPNRIVKAFSEDNACTQYLPLMFYALINKKSLDKSICLFRYGASLNTEVDTGFGWKRKFTFSDYVYMIYPQCNGMLAQAYQVGSANRLYPIRRAAVTLPKPYIARKQTPEPATSSESNLAQPQTQAPRQAPAQPQRESQVQSPARPVNHPEPRQARRPNDPFDRMRGIAESLIEFDLENGERYHRLKRIAANGSPTLVGFLLGIPAIFFLVLFLANLLIFKIFATTQFILCLATGIPALIAIIRAKLRNHGDKKNVRELLDQRKMYVHQLNEMASRFPNVAFDDWWNQYDGFDFNPGNENAVLIWSSFKRFQELPDGSVCLAPFCDDAIDVTGAQAMNLIKSQEYRTLWRGDIRPEGRYKFAQMSLLTITDGSYSYSESLSEEYIQNEMKVLNEKEDERERFWNFMDGYSAATNEERCDGNTIYGKTMGAEAYVMRNMDRQNRLERRENQLRNTRNRYVADRDKYHYYMNPVGVIVLDESGAAVAVLRNRKGKKGEHYTVNASKAVFKISHSEGGISPQEDLQIISQLSNYRIPRIDPLRRKPGEYSMKEWANLIYASHVEARDNAVLYNVRAMMSAAAQKKRQNIV